MKNNKISPNPIGFTKNVFGKMFFQSLLNKFIEQLGSSPSTLQIGEVFPGSMVEFNQITAVGKEKTGLPEFFISSRFAAFSIEAFGAFR